MNRTTPRPDGMGVRLQRLVKSLFAGGQGGRQGSRSYLVGQMPGGTWRNWATAAGDLDLNSVVQACLSWYAYNTPQAPLRVWDTATGQPTPVPDHPLEQLLRTPNPYYSGSVLVGSMLSGLVISGNAYAYIERNNLDQPMRLWWLPSHCIGPIIDANATTDDGRWISGYEYIWRGKRTVLAERDVLHVRTPRLDPRNPRLGVSDLVSALRHIFADNELQNYQAAVLENVGVIPTIVTNKTAQFAGTERQKSDGSTQWIEGPELVKELIIEKTTGDQRGQPLVLEGDIAVERLGISPAELMLTDAHKRPEATIAALCGLNTIVLNLAGGQDASSYNNSETMERLAWRNGALPRLSLIAGELATQILPLYPGSERLIVQPDTRRVPVLNESTADQIKRLVAAAGGPILTADEARAEMGYPALTSEQQAQIAERISRGRGAAGAQGGASESGTGGN